MNVIKVEDINLIEDNEYMELVDEAITKLNQKTNLDLIRKDGKIYLGNCN